MQRVEHLTGLAIFASVAAAKSFSAAARQLGLSKSAVSKHISRLERALGARLLHRTTRKLSLTEAGAALVDRAARILAELEAAELDVGRVLEAPRGILRVSAPMSFGQRHIAPMIPELLAKYPELRVELALSDRFVELIDERFDCAVRIARLPDSSLVARRLAPARRVVCGTPAYFARHGVPRRPAELLQHNCLEYTYLAATGGWPFAPPGGRLRAVPVRGNFATNNGEALRAAALAGLGVALIPTFIAGDDLRDGRLQAVLTEFETWQASIYLVHPPSRPVPAKVRALTELLARRCGPRPYWDDGLPAAARPARPRS